MKVRLPSSFGNMQEKMKKMQSDLEELENKEYTGSSGGEMVTVTILGNLSFSNIKISPEAYDDRDMLCDLIVAACNNAIRKAIDEKNEISQSATAGLNIPGFGF